MEMTAALLEDIVNTSQDCIFWKDKERRFVGVNQAFLDFYGFESVDAVFGKTDEDMGWHSDPEPFKQDELRVLNGESTYKVQGKCIIRGEERDIIASKRPLYEGDEIVGLVGSFLDVTDVVRRKKDMSSRQVMYTSDNLRAYPYFDKLLDETAINDILDPLTGIISRAYILDFAKSLIAAKIPFSFTMLDLDNFKYINDTFGHSMGDKVLMDVSREMASFTDGYGVVGRFGGDELLIINIRDYRYADLRSFFEGLYEDGMILRRNINVDGEDIYVTGTAGCAAFPENAKSYDELFSLIDKTLYRGKNRGRNCYVIYQEEKHKDLDIKKIARSGIYTSMIGIVKQLNSVKGIHEKLEAIMPMLEEEYNIPRLYYVGMDNVMHSVLDKEMKENVGDLQNITDDELFAENNFDELKKDYPEFCEALRKYDVGSILMVRIGTGRDSYGHLICADKRTRRIWQEDECAIMYYLGKYLAVYTRFLGEVL